MPYSPPNRVLAEGIYETPVASAARTATGQSGAVTLHGPIANMVVNVRVTAATGTTPTLNVDLEDSTDGGATWQKVADVHPSNITTTGVTTGRLDLATVPCTDLVRFAWTIGGTTPSFTFSIDTYAQR